MIHPDRIQLRTLVFLIATGYITDIALAQESSYKGRIFEDGISEMDYRVKQFQKARQDVMFERDGHLIHYQPMANGSLNPFTVNKSAVENNHNIIISDIKDVRSVPGLIDGASSTNTLSHTNISRRSKRQVRLSAIRGPNVWPSNIVPYYIDMSTYTTAFSRWRIQSAVSAGLRSLESLSCVKFIKRDELDAATQARIGHKHSVRIFNGVNCWSHSGCTGCHLRQSDKKTSQDLSLATSCSSAEIVQHEFGHVLGLTHEHTRTDMHKHIAVNYTLVKNPTAFYRKTHPEFINKAPYDLTSIQHYQTNALVTHSPTDMWLKLGIGRLTHYDEWCINAAYCTDGCDKTLCRNDGYMTNKDGSCKCICPEGLSGTYCESIATVGTYSCGGILHLTDQSPQISLESLNFPQRYETETSCAWLIKGPAGKTIESSITYMDLPADTSGCKHYVEIRDKLLGQVAREKCGRCSTGDCFTTHSAANTSLVIFEALEAATAGRGFRIQIQLKDDCSVCRGAPCNNGRCSPKNGEMICDFEQGLLEGCSDLRIHDSYQKSYEDITWTESAWEIAEKGPRLPGRSDVSRSANGRLHLLSIRPRALTRGPYEGVFRIVPYLIYPERSRCLKFKLFLCCDRRVTLQIYTAKEGELSASPLLTISEHEYGWRDIAVEVRAPAHITRAQPIEMVFKSSHSVSAENGAAHLGIDNIQWMYGRCY